MNNPTTNERPRGAPTGKKYDSVSALMQGENIPQPVREKVSQLISESRIATKMAQLRHFAGITQQKMADELKVTQGTISKLESGRDDDLTLKQVKEYARVTGQRISMMFGKPLSHVESVQLNAFGLKMHLEELAKIAGEQEEMQSEIRKFFVEAFANLFQIMALCAQKLPPGETEKDVQIVFRNITREITPFARKPLTTPEINPEMSASRIKTELV